MSEWPNEWPWRRTKHFQIVMRDGKEVHQQRWTQPDMKWKGKKAYIYEWRDVPVKEQS